MTYRYSTLNESSSSPTTEESTFKAPSLSNSEASILDSVKPSLKESSQSSNFNTKHLSGANSAKPHQHQDQSIKLTLQPPGLTRHQQGKLHSVLRRITRRRNRTTEHTEQAFSEVHTKIGSQENVPLKYVSSVSTLAMCSAPRSVLDRQTSQSLDNIICSTSEVNHPNCSETLMV